MDQSGINWFEHNIQPFYSFERAHHNSIETLAFNPINPLELVSGSHDKLIKVWDVQKFKNVATLTGHSQGVWATTFSPDGKLFFSGSPDKTIMLWDFKKGKPTSQLKEHKNKIYWVNISDNGLYMASGGEDGRIIIWDLRKLQFLKVLQATPGIVYNTAFLPGGKFLMSSDSQGMIKIFDTQKYELKAQSIQKPKTNEKALAIESIPKVDDGKYKIFAGYSTKVARLWTFDSLKLKFLLDYELLAHTDQVQSLGVHPTQRIFATGARDGTSRVWSIDRQNGKNEVIANLLGHNQKIVKQFIKLNLLKTRAIFMPQNAKSQANQILATGSWDQNINLYKI